MITMKKKLLTILVGLFVSTLNGQVSFSYVDINIKTININDLREIVCSDSTMSLLFTLKHNVTALQQKNWVEIDSQAVQIVSFKINGYDKSLTDLSSDDQKQLLGSYSENELNYYKTGLHVEVINPHNQWVITKSRGWFIWYFRVGKLPTGSKTKFEMQLYASTVIGNNILTINAPIQNDGNFTKAANIVNDMMESILIK